MSDFNWDKFQNMGAIFIFHLQEKNIPAKNYQSSNWRG